jgi:hypothetical protein
MHGEGPGRQQPLQNDLLLSLGGEDWVRGGMLVLVQHYSSIAAGHMQLQPCTERASGEGLASQQAWQGFHQGAGGVQVPSSVIVHYCKQ